uniref:Uncharacterized protein n=1 Tax=Schizaphis graminum TaxID=13262 RepID=A0A2S2PB96_SCHGA
MGAGRGGDGVGGHGANERVATSSSGGGRVMNERNERWHLWPADGQKANWRMCGAPCAHRVRLFVPPPPPPPHWPPHSCIRRWGELRYVSRPPPRKFCACVCARVTVCSRDVTPAADGRTVMWRRPPARPTTKRDIGDDGRTGAAHSSLADPDTATPPPRSLARRSPNGFK